MKGEMVKSEVDVKQRIKAGRADENLKEVDYIYVEVGGASSPTPSPAIQLTWCVRRCP